MRLVTTRMMSSVSAEVSLPRTTSTNFIICAGLKKCIPAQYSRRSGDSDDAMASTSKVEVLLSSRAFFFLTIVLSLEKISLFTLRFSNAASTTRSQSAKLERFVDEPRRDSIAFNLEGCIRPFLTSRCKMDWMFCTPALSPFGFTSTKVIGPNPARKKDIAIPRPIVPAPITPIAPRPFVSWFPEFFLRPDEDEDDDLSAKNMWRYALPCKL
mmetsp:Transcript_39934/g.83521  ORF Transcript_39934/g.83521 Transcript_39934/m.83521 type:complete len:212 (-) Transcript_39934:981-1616(-)